MSNDQTIKSLPSRQNQVQLEIFSHSSQFPQINIHNRKKTLSQLKFHANCKPLPNKKTSLPSPFSGHFATKLERVVPRGIYFGFCAN